MAEAWRLELQKLVAEHGPRFGVYHGRVGMQRTRIYWRARVGVQWVEGPIVTVHDDQLVAVTSAMYEELLRLRKGEACSDESQLALFKMPPASIVQPMSFARQA